MKLPSPDLAEPGKLSFLCSSFTPAENLPSQMFANQKSSYV